MRVCDLRVQKSGGVRTGRAYNSDDEIHVTRTMLPLMYV